MTEKGELVTLGAFLREEREKRGITVEQVASATKISVRLLHAIEADQFADLPAKPFIRGFVVSYSRFLNLDSQDILNRYGHFIDERSGERPTNEEGHSGYAFERQDMERSRRTLWIVMGAFGAIALLGVFVIKPAIQKSGSEAVILAQKKIKAKPKAKPAAKADEKVETKTAAEEKKVVVAKKEVVEEKKVEEPTKPVKPPEPEKKPEPKIVASNNALASVEPYRIPTESDPLNKGDTLKADEIKRKLVLKALGDVWIRYQVDGRPKMKYLLLKDRIIVFRAQDSVQFQVSDSGSVHYRVDRGSSYENLQSMKNLTDSNGAVGGVYPFSPDRQKRFVFSQDGSFPPLPQRTSGDASITSTQ